MLNIGPLAFLFHREALRWGAIHLVDLEKSVFRHAEAESI